MCVCAIYISQINHCPLSLSPLLLKLPVDLYPAQFCVAPAVAGCSQALWLVISFSCLLSLISWSDLVSNHRRPLAG